MSQLVADLLLLAVTLVWGTTFVIVKNTIGTMGPLTYLGIRFLVAGLALLIWHIVRNGKTWYKAPRRFYAGWLLTGVALFFSYATQTLGLVTVAAGKAAFITGLYVVMVPVASRALMREAPDRATVVGVILATVGLGLMSLKLPFEIVTGDFLVFLCAVGFTAHILLVDRYSESSDTVLYAAVQLLVVAVVSFALAVAVERPLFIPARAWPAIIFTALVATAFAFLTQSAVQRYTSATHTALIFSAEPVFGAFFAWWFAKEVLLTREIVGAVLILAGMVVAEARNLAGKRSEDASHARDRT